MTAASSPPITARGNFWRLGDVALNEMFDELTNMVAAVSGCEACFVYLFEGSAREAVLCAAWPPHRTEDINDGFLSVPLIASGEVIGVINIHHKYSPQHTPAAVALLSYLAEQMGG